ncbi:SWI/SNF chromatin-remodeling complex subunit [Myotisia sp. PD_48]|nr:SWI/SNF chromatin-remodeling complex subunit [Myotisia sp. PD_48]
MPWPESQDNGHAQGEATHQTSGEPSPSAPAETRQAQAQTPHDTPTHSRNGSMPADIMEGKKIVKPAVATSDLQNDPSHSVNDDQAEIEGEDGAADPKSPQHAVTNGNGRSRKRSRSGSIIRSTSPMPDNDSPQQRETPVEKILLEQYLHREWQHAALAATKHPHQELLKEKFREREFYVSIQHERQVNPAAIFQPGYEGYGNARTDLKSQHPHLLYPSNRRRPGGRKAKELKIPRENMLIQSDQAEDLVPIRIEIDWDKIKMRDTFTWNLHDRVTPPEIFAERLVEDLGLPLESCGPLVRQVSQSIHEQLADFYPQVFFEEEPLDPELPYFAYKNDEMRILIKLNITLGQHTLVDQFEWEINDPHNSPEAFALHMCRELSLPGEFTTAIAHSIREQVQLFTRSLYILSHPFDGRPIDDPDLKNAFQPSPIPSSFRPVQASKDFTPYLYEVNEAKLEQAEGNLSRDQRSKKRSLNRRGGPALPDLKDRQRTMRTMVVSSVIPGSASTIEESRLFKRVGSSRRARPSTSQRDGGDDSDSEESDDSSIGSPAMSHLAQGTARTRGMRQASSVAQSTIRGQLGRSATPESISALSETRSRRRDYREESEEPPDRLIITLKVNPLKLQRLMKELKSRTGIVSSSPIPAAKSSARGSMGPPQSQVQPSQSTPKRLPASQINGVIDAPHPPQPGAPGPSPPQWLVRGLNILQESYPNHSFEGTMRYTPVDPTTGLPIPNAAVTHAGQKLEYKYFPRIRCNDCPGKLYTPGPVMTVDNFEVHLRNRVHKERVQKRVSGTEATERKSDGIDGDDMADSVSASGSPSATGPADGPKS